MGKLYQLLYKFFNRTELERRRKDIISTANTIRSAQKCDLSTIPDYRILKGDL